MDTIKPVLVKEFKEKSAEEFSESEWIDHKFKGSDKVRFECQKLLRNPWHTFVRFKDMREEKQFLQNWINTFIHMV